jgi:hypothetical protein
MPSALSKKTDNNDQTMMTEVNYLKYLQDGSVILPESMDAGNSFFRSFLNLEKGAGTTAVEKQL